MSFRRPNETGWSSGWLSTSVICSSSDEGFVYGSQVPGREEEGPDDPDVETAEVPCAASSGDRTDTVGLR